MSEHLIALTVKDLVLSSSGYDPSIGLAVVVVFGSIAVFVICVGMVIGGFVLVRNGIENYIDKKVTERIYEIERKKSRRRK